MFPEETHQRIIKDIDNIEGQMFALYRSLNRLRLNLQSQWRVLPSGEKWNQERQEKERGI